MARNISLIMLSLSIRPNTKIIHKCLWIYVHIFCHMCCQQTGFIVILLELGLLDWILWY